jgi:fructan beta-fructosidase
MIKTGTSPLPVSGRSLLIDTTLAAGTASDFGLDVRVGNGQRVRIGYDTTTVLRRAAPTSARPSQRVHRARLPLRHHELQLKIYIDSSSVEVFSADGTVSISDLVYPDSSSTGVGVFADHGTARLESLTARTLGNAIKG